MKAIFFISILISFNLCSDLYNTNFCALWGRANHCEGFANLNMSSSLDYTDNFLSRQELTQHIIHNEQNANAIVSEVDQSYESGLSDLFTPVTFDQVKQMNDNASDPRVPDGDVNNFKSIMQYDASRPCLVVGTVSCKLYKNNRDNDYFCPNYVDGRKIWQWSNGECELKSWRVAMKMSNCHTFTYSDLSSNTPARSSRTRGSLKFLSRTGNVVIGTSRSQKSEDTCLKCKQNYALKGGKCSKTQHEGCSMVDRRGNCIKCDLSAGFVDAENNKGCVGFIKYTLNGSEKRATLDAN